MVANFDLNYLSYFKIDFQNSCAYCVANFLNFAKMSQPLQFVWVEAVKRAKNQVGTVLLDTLYMVPFEVTSTALLRDCTTSLINRVQH